jgi:hypothetical protein
MKNIIKNFLTLMALVVCFTAHADIEQSNRSCSWDNAENLQAGSCDKGFVKVENGETSATLDSGMPVILDYSDDNGAIVVSSATAADVPYCVMAESCASGEQGCDCQVWGVMTDFQYDDRVDLGSAATATAGTFVYLSEYLAGYGQAKPTDLAVDDYPIGVVLDDSSASADIEVFIKLK